VEVSWTDLTLSETLVDETSVKVAAPPVHETPDLPELLHDAADSA
jgi:hypothetical protein